MPKKNGKRWRKALPNLPTHFSADDFGYSTKMWIKILYDWEILYRYMFTCSETEGGLICILPSELVGTNDPGICFEEFKCFVVLFVVEFDKCSRGEGCCWGCINIGSCPKSEILDNLSEPSVSLWIAFVMSRITLV